ncbi:MAG TPA: hypothetical protein VLL98_00205 [Rickettsiales bacterium]|nr:hypothetical protein [Rickettsiales bacterium]
MQINTNQLKQFGNNLIKIKIISFPEIMNRVLNTTAYNINNKLKKETIQTKFIKRNNFAPMSIRYTKAIGYDMNTMNAMVGQLANAGNNNTKTILEENELGQTVTSKTKHTTLGLKTIRTGNTFNKTIKKENRLANLKPAPASNILRTFRFDTNQETLELSRISMLIAHNRIKTWNNNSKPIIAYTKNNKVGIFRITKQGDNNNNNKSNNNSATNNTINNKLQITKFYSFNNKQTHIKKREWLKPTYESELNNMNKIYTQVAQNVIDSNARAFSIKIRNY